MPNERVTGDAEKVSETPSLSERVRFYGLGTETFFNADDFLILANEVAELERKLAALSTPPSADERQRAIEECAAIVGDRMKRFTPTADLIACEQAIRALSSAPKGG